MAKLWFDVGIETYTTLANEDSFVVVLWFDVGIETYTTITPIIIIVFQLWFDVGIETYTTQMYHEEYQQSCGLM